MNIGFLPLPVDPISKAMTHPLRSTGITPLQHYYEAVRPSPAHRYFRPRGWSRLRLFPWHRRPGSHVPYKSQIELRAAYMPDAAWAVSVHPPSLSRKMGQPPVLTSSNRHFCSGSLALASLNRACRNLVPTFPQRSPPSLLTTAACGGLRSAPDCRPRRTYLHLSYSYAPPCGPALLVTQDPSATLGVHCTNRFSHYQRASFSGYNAVPVIGFLHAGSPDPNVNLSFRNSGAPVRKDDPEAVPECDQVPNSPQ